jgi:hypothetical protein
VARQTAQRQPERRGHAGRNLRLFVWVALILSWLIMLLYAWSAFATFPSTERLERSQMAQIPTLTTVALIVLRSGIELSVLLALLWPWSRRFYELRVATAAVVLPIYFLMTAPLTLTRLEWVHRRWLAVVELGLLAVLAAAFAAAVFAWIRRPRSDRAS